MLYVLPKCLGDGHQSQIHVQRYTFFIWQAGFAIEFLFITKDLLYLNPNRSLGHICYVFYYYLLPFVFYKASDACFLLEIVRYYSQKQQATSALLKIQNATSPNDQIGLIPKHSYTKVIVKLL